MKSERQLIDVEVAKGYVETFMADPILKMAANAVLDSAPRADAVEVVHGRWVHHYNDSGEPIDDKWYCSECHMCNAHKRTWYCPNCGAKMDGGKNDND